MKINHFRIGSFLTVMLCGVMGATTTSCGGSDKSKGWADSYSLSPETTAIKGDLSDYYEVVKKDYTASNDNDWSNAFLVSVEIKRTDKEFVFDAESTKPMGTVSEGMTGNAGFGIEILDENGNVIQKAAATNGGLGGMYSDDDMKEALKLKPGETATVRWSLNFTDEEKPTKFRLTSAYEKSGYDGGTNAAAGDDSAASSGNDWDSVLDSYEKYVDNYIKYYKKAQSGDIAAMTEMASLLESAQDLQNKLDSAESELTAAQAARMTKINAKLMAAM